MERKACFFSGAHGPLPSLQLSVSLSLLGKSLSGVFCSGAARAAAHQGASRRARHVRAMRTAASQLGKRRSKMQFSHPGVWVPARRSFRCMLLRYIYITEARIGSLRPRAGVAASASEAAGGEFEGGLEHWTAGTKPRHSVRGRLPQGSAFRCSPGTPPGSLREAPGGLPGARSSAR